MCDSALRSLNGFIRYVRNQPIGAAEYGTRTVAEVPVLYEADLDPAEDA
jgi:hypothetical protein